jgi:hypothetical protein
MPITMESGEPGILESPAFSLSLFLERPAISCHNACESYILYLVCRLLPIYGQSEVLAVVTIIY